jgi:hypothetical protein
VFYCAVAASVAGVMLKRRAEDDLSPQPKVLLAAVLPSALACFDVAGANDLALQERSQDAIEFARFLKALNSQFAR